jgi:hypothetical protein
LLLGVGVLAGSGFNIAGFAAGPANEPVRDVIQLRNASGSALREYPMRIGRPFVSGEIRSLPQAAIGTTRLPTQADVKTSWPDGSVQYAILSFVVPQIRAGGSVMIGFVNGELAAITPMSTQEMLDRSFDFDGLLEITQQGQTRKASARAMLEAGDFTVWCDGPIATTVLIADHSAARKYDLGFDELRSVRPIFHATFWRGLRKVQVRAIGENANTETLQDLDYSLVLRAGVAAPVEVFRQDSVPHYAATRWTKSFWIGGAPDPRVDIDHGLAHLAATRAFPNFDASLRVPDQVVARTYVDWQKRPKGLYDPGGWVKYMPTTGGRDDIGPYPSMVTKWLYTGDHRLFEAVSTMADLAGAWPLHVREGDPHKHFDANGRVPGIGRVLSVHARPSLWLLDERSRSAPEDRVSIHGQRILSNTYPKTNGGWDSDGSHQPDPYSALYMLTGDPFSLEQAQFWAASQALKYDPEHKRIPDSGNFMDQVRGCAWVLRNRVHAAYLSPDETPEKAYFKGLVDDVIGFWEGRVSIRGTPFEGKPTWQSGQKEVFASPLHFFADQPIRDRKELHASTEGALWEHYMLIFELGRSKEKGFLTGPLLSWLAVVLTGQFKEGPAYSPYNLGRYWTGVRDNQHQFFQTWTATLASYKEPQAPTALGQNVADGYATYAYAASTMITGEPGGANAYDWLRKKLYDPLHDRFAENPKWAFLPRT